MLARWGKTTAPRRYRLPVFNQRGAILERRVPGPVSLTGSVTGRKDQAARSAVDVAVDDLRVQAVGVQDVAGGRYGARIVQP